MRSLPILIIALIIAVVIPHVCAGNVTSFYIDPSVFSNNGQKISEYNNAITRADSITESWHNNKDNWMLMSYNDPFNVLNYRLIAIQIALEKQNELINEQNELLGRLLNQTYTENGVYLIKPNH